MTNTRNNFLILLLFSFFPILSYSQHYDQINKDFKNGTISKNEAILQKFYLGFNTEKALVKYKNSIGLGYRKCGTDLIIEYHKNKSSLNKNIISEIENFISAEKLFKVTSKVYTSPYGKFEMTYETTGLNAVPIADNNSNSVPDYVEKIADYFDYTWKKLIDSMGYLPPPIGNGKYKVSFESMEYYGYTNVDGSNTKSTYIVMHNNFIGFPANDDTEGDQLGAAKVTAFHEFKHATQIMYNYWNDPSWFLEMDATWSEEIGFDNVNDYYNYLSESQIRQPGRSFENGSGYEDCLWIHYLSQSFGNKINKDIWQRRQVNGFEDTYQCFNNILTNYSSTFNNALTKYFTWNCLSGDFSVYNLEGYEEASRYPTPTICKDINNLPFDYSGCNRDKLSAAFINILPGNDLRKIAISFAADFGNNNFAVISILKNSTNKLDYIFGNASDLNYLTDLPANQIERLLFIPVNLSNGSANYTFNGKVEYFIPAIFTHRKLKDIETESSRKVLTKLTTPFDYAIKDSLKLYYSKDNQNYTSMLMQKTSNADEYTTEIPSQGYEVTVNYYFRTVDTDGNEYFYPGTAPDTSFSFYAGKDLTPPNINIFNFKEDKSIYNFPQEIFAIVEDNIDINSASLDVSYGNLESYIEMTKVKDSLYFASIDIDSSLVNTGDKINYKISATDVSLASNTAHFPDNGFNSINIVDGIKYSSKPNLLMPDMNLISKRDTIIINDDIEINDIDINLNITHNRPSDLELRLKTPSGNTSYVISRPGLESGFTSKNLLITLDNEAFRDFANPFLINTEQFEGHFLPTKFDLNSLSNTNAKGAWILLAYDKESGEEGVINEWSLVIRKKKILDVDESSELKDYNVLSNYPNPFNAQTNINFSLSQNTILSLKVYNILGELVVELIDGKEFSVGNHVINFNSSSYSRQISSGIYFCKLTSKEFNQTIKMLLLK